MAANQLHAFLHSPAFASKIHHPIPPRSILNNAPGSETIQAEEVTSIQVPLKYVGPYPTIGLRFPDLATRNQKLELEVVGEALPGVGSAGAISGGSTFMLGDAQLEGTGTEPFIFVQNLTAAALPIASPASAGLLSQAFFYCFEGGVEFDWGSQSLEDGLISTPASITFHGARDSNLETNLCKLTRVSIDPVPVTQLPSIMLKINGVEVPALLDTGSPITVLNSQAAQQVGVKPISIPSTPDKSQNPFAAVANRFKSAQATSNAAAKGDLLTIAGSNGQPTSLLKAESAAEIRVSGDSEDVSFGEHRIFVGDIPGLAALNGIGVNSPPAAVLGMDVLKKRQKMLLRARNWEVYF
eukprot:scaffold388_cov114-Cylindrotheca_fusiformis.AAC.5